MIKKANYSQRVLQKSKRCKSFMHAHLDRKKPRRKLRVARRTRFNSNAEMLDSWLLNQPRVSELMRTEDFKQCWSASQAYNKRKRTEILKAWDSQPTIERAKRAQKILRPIAIFCREVASAPLPGAWPAWLRCKRKLKQSYREADFKDHTKGDTDDSKAERLAMLDTVLQSREAMTFQAPQKAATCFDARLVGRASDAALDAALGWNYEEGWQQSISAAHRVLNGFFPEPATRGLALQSFKHYLEKTGEYRQLQYPGQSDSLLAVQEWWRCKQPCHCLKKVALSFWAAQPTQGRSERVWATLSRQVQPIRSGLSSKTKECLAKVCANWWLAFPSVPQPACNSKRRHRFALEGDDLEAKPDEATLFSEDECATSSSSSSSTSTSESA